MDDRKGLFVSIGIFVCCLLLIGISNLIHTMNRAKNTSNASGLGIDQRKEIFIEALRLEDRIQDNERLEREQERLRRKYKLSIHQWRIIMIEGVQTDWDYK